MAILNFYLVKQFYYEILYVSSTDLERSGMAYWWTTEPVK